MSSAYAIGGTFKGIRITGVEDCTSNSHCKILTLEDSSKACGCAEGSCGCGSDCACGGPAPSTASVATRAALAQPSASASACCGGSLRTPALPPCCSELKAPTKAELEGLPRLLKTARNDPNAILGLPDSLAAKSFLVKAMVEASNTRSSSVGFLASMLARRGDDHKVLNQTLQALSEVPEDEERKKARLAVIKDFAALETVPLHYRADDALVLSAFIAHGLSDMIKTLDRISNALQPAR